MSDKLDVNKIKKFIDDSINTLTTTDYTCCEYKLDNDLSLFVGWAGGYEPEPDDTLIFDKDDPSFAINAGIKSNHEYMKTDFDWLTSPYDAKTGEVWDTDMTVPQGGMTEFDAKWYIEQYQEIRKALDAGEIVLESKKEEAVYREGEISFKEIIDKMDSAEDYADLYNAAGLIMNMDLRIDVENLIGQCEDDEDAIDQAVSIICSDLLDAYADKENVEHFEESKKVEEAKVTDYINEEDLDKAIKENPIMGTCNRYEVLNDMFIKTYCDSDNPVYKVIKGEDGKFYAYYTNNNGTEKLGDEFFLFEGKKLQEAWAEDIDFVADYVLANIEGKDNVEFEDLRNIIYDGLKEFYPEMSEEELGNKESDIEPDIRTILSLNGYGTDFVTGDITTDLDSLEEGKLEEDANTLDNSDEEDLATYLYSDIMETAAFERYGSIVEDYEFESLEEIQDWYDSSVTEEMYNKVTAIVDRVLKNTKYYDDSDTAGVDISIELNDNHTLWDIEAPEGYEDDGSFLEVSYAQLVNDAAKEFEERTGVPLKYLGRSGRHVCVANNFLNAYRYNELKAVQEELEQKVINDANAMLNETEPVEESKKVEEGKMTFNMEFKKAESRIGEGRKILNDILENEELDEATDTFIRDIIKKLCDVEMDIMNFGKTKTTESKKLEEKDTKQEYQDYCKDLGLDCNKKSSINKFLNDYAQNLATIQGTKDFEEKMAQVKKELRESISKKEEATDAIELNTTSNILKGIADKINKTCSNLVSAQTAEVDDVVGIRLTRKGDQDLISLFDNIVGVMDANNIGRENYEIDLRGNDLILAVKNMTV